MVVNVVEYRHSRVYRVNGCCYVEVPKKKGSTCYIGSEEYLNDFIVISGLQWVKPGEICRKFRGELVWL